MSDFSHKVKGLLSSEKGRRLAVIAGLAGIALIFVSNFVPQKPEKTIIADNTDTSAFVDRASEEICKVVSSITGEDDPTVYITASSGISKVYAVEVRREDDLMEEETVIIKNSSGDQTGLLINETQPEIKGVVVVSEMAGDPVTKEKIISAVRVAFDIPSDKVCVVAKYK